jgi:hypothetical protein
MRAKECERQEEEVDVARLAVLMRSWTRRSPDDCRAFGHAFRRTSRPRRVDDRRERAAVEGGHPPVDLGVEARAPRGPAREHVRKRPRTGSFDRHDRAERNRPPDAVELEALAAHLLDLRALLRVLEHHAIGAGVGDDVAALVGEDRGIHRNRHRPDGQDRKVGLHPFGTGRRQERHAITGLDAVLDQRGGEVAYALGHRRPRDFAPHALIEVAIPGTIGELCGTREEHVREVRVGHDGSSRWAVGSRSGATRSHRIIRPPAPRAECASFMIVRPPRSCVAIPILRRWVIVAPERTGDLMPRRAGPVDPVPVAEVAVLSRRRGRESGRDREWSRDAGWSVRVTPDRHPLLRIEAASTGARSACSIR